MLRKNFMSVPAVALAVLLPAAGAFAVKPDRNIAPVVTAFDIPSSSVSPVPVTAFTATDSDGTVAGFLITETPATPDAGDSGWSAEAPGAYATTSSGLVTLFAWAKDNEGAVSDSLSDTVSIPPPPIDADTLDGLHASEIAG